MKFKAFLLFGILCYFTTSYSMQEEEYEVIEKPELEEVEQEQKEKMEEVQRLALTQQATKLALETQNLFKSAYINHEQLSENDLNQLIIYQAQLLAKLIEIDNFIKRHTSLQKISPDAYDILAKLLPQFSAQANKIDAVIETKISQGSPGHFIRYIEQSLNELVDAEDALQSYISSIYLSDFAKQIQSLSPVTKFILCQKYSALVNNLVKKLSSETKSQFDLDLQIFNDKIHQQIAKYQRQINQKQ